ncbi:MAG: SDR family NAD(P)-dependent oxidoreductase [Halodesulfurarchaeum sp.]
MDVSDSASERVEPPEITEDDVLFLEDELFSPDSVAIVTGAASGIGRATAITLAANGLTVGAADVDAEGLARTVARGEDIGAEGDIVPIEADLTVDEDLETIVETAASHGNVRFLANVAGIQHIDPIEDFPIETYDTMHRVMLRAPVLLSKHVIPHIKDTDDGRGVIGNMASVHGHYVTADKVGYNVAKFGLRGLTQSIAAEGEGAIRAFSVSTGYVKTPLVTNQIPDTAEQRGISIDEVIEDVMLGQARTPTMMEPVEVANLFTFGFSTHAQHLNGGDLLFDGGMTLTYE